MQIAADLLQLKHAIRLGEMPPRGLPITHSGQPPAFVEWCRVEQMPELAKRYRKQFDDRIESLQMMLANLQSSIAAGRLDQQGEADQISAEIAWLSELVA